MKGMERLAVFAALLQASLLSLPAVAGAAEPREQDVIGALRDTRKAMSGYYRKVIDKGSASPEATAAKAEADVKSAQSWARLKGKKAPEPAASEAEVSPSSVPASEGIDPSQFPKEIEFSGKKTKSR